MQKVFGPVPSRRLGKSIGINNIPPKICTYSCIYCQIGKAIKMTSARQTFYPPEELVGEVSEKLDSCNIKNESVDYITLVPDGEPTLDENAGELINQLRKLDIPVAVITNASLLHLEKVRAELSNADYVSVKIDAIDEKTWKEINKPVKGIHLENILEGIKTFSSIYTGTLTTETMLIDQMNDSPEEMKGIAGFISEINPETAYLAVPTRPPAFERARPATENTLNIAYHIFSEKNHHVEYLTGYEGNAFSASGNTEKDLLSITAVHPMRSDAVAELVKKNNSDMDVVESLIKKGLIKKTSFKGNAFYVRTIKK